ncbi:hypothetical protein Vi05172_g8169 [Venturia inaequalis]|nr:hypothetical protein Vi05172_g8169 [Venturia inaequalis]
MNVHINRFDQLRRAVYGYESGLSGQLRQLTVHGDNRLGLHRLRDHSIINASDWENLRFLSLAADDFEDMFTTLTPTRDMIGRGSRTVGRPAMSNARGSPPLFIGTRRSDSSRPVDTVAIMCQLINQLLSYNNGCLRIQGRSFLGTFQVYGKKGQKASQLFQETKLYCAFMTPQNTDRCWSFPLNHVNHFRRSNDFISEKHCCDRSKG